MPEDTTNKTHKHSTAMFLGNGRFPQHSHSPYTLKADVNQATPSAWLRRQMGPPQTSFPPQPVEIDPISYPRAPGSYPPWESAAYSTSILGESNPLSNSIGPNKSAPSPLDLGTRNSPQDPIANWYNGNDGPWVPKGAVPEISLDERMQARGYAPYRNPGFGSTPVPRHRSGNPSDNGSVLFGISPSDSGYGTGSTSVRGSDIVDQSQDNRSVLGRVYQTHRYNQGGCAGELRLTEQWPYNSPSGPLLQCPTCHRRVKTKSELKKHDLRHTKPFRCTNRDCLRKEGFSTVNDLNRHRQSKHRGDFPGEIQAKTYRCLVPGCKSHEKVWPRLDNFRNHLKRMHKLPELGIDEYVHRSNKDQQTNGRLSSQGSYCASPSRLDHCVPLGLGSDDFPELTYPGDHPQWTDANPGSPDPQPEGAEPLLENTNIQALTPSSADSPIGLEGSTEKPVSLKGSMPSCDSNAGHGCLENGTVLTPSNAIGESISVLSKNSLSSPVDTSNSTDAVETGKILEKSPPVEQSLREAIITAVISVATLGKEIASGPHSKSLPAPGSPAMAKVSRISSYTKDRGTTLPSPAATSGNHPGDQEFLRAAPPASVSDTLHLADEEAQVQRFLQVIKDAGFVLKKKTKTQAGPGQNINNIGAVANKKRDPVSCSKCKFSGRPCELKKHMKRHTRPYGCTKCQKSFGSKNDWKRHETSQHYQHEMWKCDEKIDGASCTKVFFSADIARAHLTKVHKVTDPDTIQRTIDARRIGANNSARFWCGFCEGLIDLIQRGVDGWTERFNHIDDHLMGKNGRTKQSITLWKAADDDSESTRPDVLAQPPSPKESDNLPSDNLSPSRSDSSSASMTMSIVPPSPVTASAQPKRKRADSDGRGGRAKQARYGRSELRTQCCECGYELNPRTDTTCVCGHDICDSCPEKQVTIQKDNSK